MSEYRYTLTRDLGEGRDEILVWVMLNPSTADETVDDPTIRRVKSFTAREGYRHLEVVNLYALRATDPHKLMGHPDPFGPENAVAVARAINRAADIVFAWGSYFDKPARTRIEMPPIPPLAAHAGLTAKCLGKTKHGAPRHPLYVKGDTPLEVY